MSDLRHEAREPVVRLDGSAAPKNLTTSLPGTENEPTPSPDGRWLAFSSMARAGFEADHLVDVGVAGGKDQYRAFEYVPQLAAQVEAVGARR